MRLTVGDTRLQYLLQKPGSRTPTIIPTLSPLPPGPAGPGPSLGPVPPSYTTLLSPDIPMSPRGRHADCGGPLSPRGRHVDCGGPVGHERPDCSGHNLGPDRGDYSRAMDPPDRLDRGSTGRERMDYMEHGLVYISHDQLADLGPHERFGPHHRLDCSGPSLGPDRLECVGPDTNMNLCKFVPDVRHMVAEDELKDDYTFSGYGLLQDRSCVEHHRVSVMTTFFCVFCLSQWLARTCCLSSS